MACNISFSHHEFLHGFQASSHSSFNRRRSVNTSSSSADQSSNRHPEDCSITSQVHFDSQFSSKLSWQHPMGGLQVGARSVRLLAKQAWPDKQTFLPAEPIRLPNPCGPFPFDPPGRSGHDAGGETCRHRAQGFAVFFSLTFQGLYLNLAAWCAHWCTSLHQQHPKWNKTNKGEL